ncbi:MAG: type II toxin-antitoxin system RelE/ParE family toxin [Nanoarchaeota archaeon]|nr:type II toxin-antitoxin system RelE/ParE family toxin [Nanoarchaeota archaeon]
MSFEVIFDPEAIDFLKKLEKPLRERIYNKIMASSDNPFHFFEKLAERHEFKLRVGDYRVVVDINQSINRIEVTLIGHRKNVYSKLERK